MEIIPVSGSAHRKILKFINIYLFNSGETKMYIWKIPARSGSERGDPQCIAWAYHSTVDIIKVYY